MKLACLIIVASVLGGPARAASLRCLDGFALPKASRDVGVETVHRTFETIITIFVPLPEGPEGYLENLNLLNFDAKYPRRFHLSDGTLDSAFIGVDISEGSRLNRCVSELASRFRMGERPGQDPYVRLVHFLDDYLAPVPEGFRFPWEGARSPALPPEFRRAGKLPVGHYPLHTSLRHPEVSLEAFLAEGRGVCLQRVLLLSLLMKELGLRHRVRAGGTHAQAGHVWIELPDRRHLDPTWHLLEKPGPAEDGWFSIDRSYLFRNQVFPFAVDGD